MKFSLKPFFRKIRTADEYHAATKSISQMIDRSEELTPKEVDYLDLLGTLVEDYEKRMAPEVYADLNKPITPIQAIEWTMDKHGLRQKDLCPYIGSEATVSAVMNGTRGLSKAMIYNLHEGLGIPYEHLISKPSKPSYRKVAMF